MRLAFGAGLVAAFALRQRRRVPGVRLAAAAQGDRARLSARLPRFAPRAGDRPCPPGARRQRRPRRRALPDRPDGHGGRAVLARTAGPAGRLVRLWLGHGGSAQRIGLLARHPPPRRLRPRLGPARRSGSRWSGAGRAPRSATSRRVPSGACAPDRAQHRCSRPTFVAALGALGGGRHAGLLARRRWPSPCPPRSA